MHFIRGFGAALLLMAQCLHGASAQSYPTRQVRVLAPEIGGASDISARLIAQWLSASFGQPVIIDKQHARTAHAGLPLRARRLAGGPLVLRGTSTVIVTP